jgi:predicted O-methyltransferase YrrM
MGAHLTGIDLDENAIIYAQQNARERTVADSTVFIKRSFDQIDLFGCDQFDFVFDWRCLLEMTDPQLRKEYIHNVYRILRK